MSRYNVGILKKMMNCCIFVILPWIGLVNNYETLYFSAGYE